MRYLPTIDLWANEGRNQDLIRAGKLRLIPGQWCQCGNGPKCRWVGISSGGILWVAHPEGAKGTLASFARKMQVFYAGQKSRTRFGGIRPL